MAAQEGTEGHYEQGGESAKGDSRRKDVHKKTRRDLEHLESNDPLTSADLPDFLAGLREMQGSVELWRSLNRETYEKLSKDVDIFEWALFTFEKNPDLQMAIVSHAPYMLDRLAARRPAVLFKFRDRFSDHPKFQEALKHAAPLLPRAEKLRAEVENCIGKDGLKRFAERLPLFSLYDIELLTVLNELLKLNDSVKWYGFVGAIEYVEKELKDDRLRPEFMKIVRAAGYNWMTVCTYFEDFREEFYDDHLRPHILEVIKIGDWAYVDNILHTVFRRGAYGTQYVRQAFRDDRLRPALLELLRLQGGEYSHNLHRVLPVIWEEFSDDTLRSNLMQLARAGREKLLDGRPEQTLGALHNLAENSEVRVDFRNPALRPHLIRLIERSHYSFLHEGRYDKIRPLLLNPSTREDFMRFAELMTASRKIRHEQSGGEWLDVHDYNFLAGAPFGDHKLQPIFMRMIELNKDYPHMACIIFPNIKEDMQDPQLSENVLRMYQQAGRFASILFAKNRYGSVYQDIRETLKQKGYEAVRTYFEDCLKLAHDAGDVAVGLFDEEFPFLKDTVKQKGYLAVSAYWHDCVRFARAIGRWWHQYVSRTSYAGVKNIRKEFDDPKLRPDIIRIAEATRGKGLPIIYEWFPKEFKNKKKRERLVRLAQAAGESAKDFFEHVYTTLPEENIKKPEEIEAAAARFQIVMKEFTDWRNDKSRRLGIFRFDLFFEKAVVLKRILKVPLFDLMAAMFHFVMGTDAATLPDLVNKLYAVPNRDLRSLHLAVEALEIISPDGGKGFVAALDINAICKPWQTTTVEEKVIVGRFFAMRAGVKPETLVTALALTKQDVDQFLAAQQVQPQQQKLSNYFYIVEGYDLLNDPDAIARVLKDIDFTKIMREKLGPEIFGLLEKLKVPPEIWERVIREMPLDLSRIQTVEATRKKLVETIPEQANQIIEMKAREYVEAPITPQNLLEKVDFARTWENPGVSGMRSGLDDRFVFDIYVWAARQMKSALKQFCLQNECGGIEKWGLFDEKGLKEIARAQKVFVHLERERAKEAVVVVSPRPQPVLSPEQPVSESPEDLKEKSLVALRELIMSEGTPDVSGIILDARMLEERLALYVGFKAEGLQEQMSFIREQVVSYINRTKDVFDQEVTFKGQKRKLKDILPELDIQILGSAANAGAYAKKVFKRDIGYSLRRAREMAAAKFYKEGVRTVERGLAFESGFDGGGENYKGGAVLLRESDVHPCAALYTVRDDDGDVLGVVLRFDPKKGAKFDFLVQVGATTMGNKRNLREALKNHYKENLVFDTVGAMVQGAGMPISMIFENGQPKNKKTTLEGQRDGLVVFNQRGKMVLMNKTEIHYWQLSRVVDMRGFERYLKEQIKRIEAEFLKELPLDGQIDLKALAVSNPDRVREYRRLLQVHGYFNYWKTGGALNYASEGSYIPQDLFWMIARYGKLSGFIESLYVEDGKSMVAQEGSGAHKRLLLEFTDGTFGIYDTRVSVNDSDVATEISKLAVDGVRVKYAVNLDTGMADDTKLYDIKGNSYQIGYTSDPVGTNRIGVYYEAP